MFTANSKLDVGTGRPASFDRDRDQLANAIDVDADERIDIENSITLIIG